MWIDLSDDETTSLLRELDRIVESDRYPFSPRIRTPAGDPRQAHAPNPLTKHHAVQPIATILHVSTG